MASGDSVLLHIAELPASSVAELYKVRERNRCAARQGENARMIPQQAPAQRLVLLRALD